MLWIWSCPVSTKELFLKIAVTKRQTKSLKSNCELVSFYSVSKLYTWNLLETSFPQAFLKDSAKAFLKDFPDFLLCGIVKNLIIYFTESFWYFSHYRFATILLFYHNFISASFKKYLPVVVSASTCLKVTPKNLK